jgi:ferredoxin
MSYIVTEQCINCKYTDCVEVCPVEAFHEGPNFVVINPDQCIDCDLCRAACPVGAIYAPEDLPADFSEFVHINAAMSAQWPVILEKKEASAHAKDWEDRHDKRAHLELQAIVSQRDSTPELELKA